MSKRLSTMPRPSALIGFVFTLCAFAACVAGQGFSTVDRNAFVDAAVAKAPAALDGAGPLPITYIPNDLFCEFYDVNLVYINFKDVSTDALEYDRTALGGQPKLKRCIDACDSVCGAYQTCNGYQITLCRDPCCNPGASPIICSEAVCDDPTKGNYSPGPSRPNPLTRCYGLCESCPPGHVCGDPHFRPLSGGGSFDFMGVAGMPFALVTEPESVMNGLFDAVADNKEYTFVTALGYMDANNTVTVRLLRDACIAQETDEGARVEVVINEAVHALNLTGVGSLFTSETLNVTYQRVPHSRGQEETIQISNRRMSYAVVRPPVACHLNLGLYVTDDHLATHPELLHGLLGTTARWGKLPEELRRVEGDESNYMLQSLTDKESFAFSTYHGAAKPLALDGGTVPVEVEGASKTPVARKMLEAKQAESMSGGLVHAVGCGAIPRLLK